MDKINYKKEIEALDKKSSNNQKVKVAIIGSYTLNNLLLPLRYYLLKNGFNPEIKIGGYNQFIQELSDNSSWLNEFRPDVTIVALSSRTYFDNIELNMLNKDVKTVRDDINKKFDFLKKAVESYKHPSKILITNIDHPSYSPLGFRDLTEEDGLYSVISDFNRKLYAFARENPSVLINDFESISSRIGKNNFFDEKMFYLGRILLSDAGADGFAKELTVAVNAIYERAKKCLVVDLDNTLWGGVIGEDGPTGIQISETNIGLIYEDIQKIILNLKKEGIMLAISSKNNEKDVIEAFANNKKMILKESDFLVKKVNWNSKSENIMRIANELNIGLDSIAFLDDNPVERLEVKTNLPMVEVIDFPEDVSLLPRFLKQVGHFKKMRVTEEDKQRHRMYEEDRKRQSIKTNLSVDDYLSKLGTKVQIKINDIDSLDRITQLINKTNQFNLRTKRYTLEEVKSMMTSDKYKVYSLSVNDNFGESGLTGVAIIREDKDCYFIDSLLLSCRILSRKIEQKFFREILNSLKNKQYKIKAEYIPTQKNEMVKTFYEGIGLKLIKEENGIKSYDNFINKIDIKDIKFIEVEKNG